MFGEWIRESGKSQAQFMEYFAGLMNAQPRAEFDPLRTLREMADGASRAQADMMKSMAGAQQGAMDELFGIAKAAPYFLNWATYKTTIGSNGRIVIPEAERDALTLGEGDLIQVIVLPISRRSGKKEVKE